MLFKFIKYPFEIANIGTFDRRIGLLDKFTEIFGHEQRLNNCYDITLYIVSIVTIPIVCDTRKIRVNHPVCFPVADGTRSDIPDLIATLHRLDSLFRHLIRLLFQPILEIAMKNRVF